MNLAQAIINNKKFLLFVYAFAAVLQIIFFKFILFDESKFCVCADSGEYISVAKSIADGKGICKLDGSIDFYRVPGYSIFLATVGKVFKFDLKKVILIQIFFASFIPILIFLLSLVLFHEKFLIAKVVSFFMTTSVGLILHAGLIMSDVLFLIFFLIFSILFFSCFDLFFYKKTYYFGAIKKMFLAGVFLGLASLVRPVGQFILIISFLLLLFSNLHRIQKIKNLTAFIFGWLLIVSWWLARNFIYTGLIFFHTMPADHFFKFFAAEIVEYSDNLSFGQARDRLNKELNNLVKIREEETKTKLHEFEKDKLKMDLVYFYTEKYWKVAINRGVANICKTFLGLSSGHLYFLNSIFPDYGAGTSFWTKVKFYLSPKLPNNFLVAIIYFDIVWLCMVLFGFFATLIRSFLDKNLLNTVLKILPIIGLLAFLTLGSGIARLRLPIEPFLIILAVNFWVYFWGKIFKHESFTNN